MISLDSISREYFKERLQLKYGESIALIQEFDSVSNTELVTLYCNHCGLTFKLSYRTLFARDTIKGCSYCKHNKKHRVFGFTNEIFLQEAQAIWKDHFSYVDLDLKKDIRAEEQQIKVFCNICDVYFITNIRYHLYLNRRGGGCPNCPKRLHKEAQSETTESFIQRAVDKWGCLYDYSEVNYINIDTQVKIFCKQHKDYFLLTPYKHLNNKYGCPICGNKRKNDHTKIKLINAFNKEIKRREIEGELDLSNAQYNGFVSPVKLICKKCGCQFSTIGQHFIDGGGRCPTCNPPRSYSKVANEALTKISVASGLTFMCGINGKEFVIPREKNIYKVDAYNAELNLVIEFYGDAFHGNPQRYAPDDRCHPYFKDITAQELYLKTKERDAFIIASGYNLIIIWEGDWYSDPNAVLTQVLNQINSLRIKK